MTQILEITERICLYVHHVETTEKMSSSFIPQ